MQKTCKVSVYNKKYVKMEGICRSGRNAGANSGRSTLVRQPRRMEHLSEAYRMDKWTNGLSGSEGVRVFRQIREVRFFSCG
ncbi:MAG: hypothetical protein LUF85_03045 [Bacteroides sp.]|nr:hypothetical protein [Bacteroides sp.]